MKTFIKYLLSALVGFTCGFFLKKSLIGEDRSAYDFSNPMPQFDARQKEIIKNVYGKILGEMKNPSSFYISQVDETNSKIVVYLNHLESLRDGEDVRSGEIRATMDGQVRFVFDKSYNIISMSKGG